MPNGISTCLHGNPKRLQRWQAFKLTDDTTPRANLTLSAASSNLMLVPLANITFGGSGANRTVTVRPAGVNVCTATITVTVTDGNNATAPSHFVVTVKTLLENEFSVGRDRTGPSSVTLRNAAGTVLYTLTPFGTSFTGGIRTTSGDVTGDGVADLIVASGPGMAGTVKVFDGVSQAIPSRKTSSFGSSTSTSAPTAGRASASRSRT
ncbi:hypothetical protein BH11PLA2_BH11PLA2_45290 [soil metagenome]